MTLDELRSSTAAMLSVEQARRALADIDGELLDPRTILRACKDGQLPCVRVGRRVLIPREPLIRLIETGAA